MDREKLRLPAELPEFNRRKFAEVPDNAEYYTADDKYAGHMEILDLIADGLPSSEQAPFEGLSPHVSLAFATQMHVLLEWAASTNAEKAVPGYPNEYKLEFDFAGDNSSVILLGGSRPIAVKTYANYKQDIARLEAWYLFLLSQYKDDNPEDPSPVRLPDYIRYKAAGRAILAQLWQTRLDGKKLSNDEVRHLSDAEKAASGEKVGALVVWMARAVSPEQYKAIHESAGSPLLFDRADLMRKFANIHNLPGRLLSMNDREFAARAEGKANEMYPPLAYILHWLETEYKALEDEGLLISSMPIVGHDDLRPGNLTFEDNDGLCILDGAYDFGLTRIMDPERIFRHIVSLGKAFYEPAIARYESETGYRVDYRKLRFWAIGQTATLAAAYWLNRNRSPGLRETSSGLQNLREIMLDLQTLLPEHDWSGLAA